MTRSHGLTRTQRPISYLICCSSTRIASPSPAAGLGMGVATLGDSRRYDCRIDNRKSAIAFKSNAAQERVLAPAYKTRASC